MHADKTGTPKFRGSGCQFPQSQCHPSPRTGIALGTRLGKDGKLNSYRTGTPMVIVAYLSWYKRKTQGNLLFKMKYIKYRFLNGITIHSVT